MTDRTDRTDRPTPRARSGVDAAATDASPRRWPPTSRHATRRHARTTRSTSTSARSTPRSPTRATAERAPAPPGRRASTTAHERERPDRGRPPAAGPVRPATAARRDRLVRGLARAPRHAGRRRPPGAAPSCRARRGAARRQDVPRRGHRPATNRWSGSPATRRSATASRRSSAPGSATRRPSPCSNRGPPSPTSAASSSPTRPPPGSRRSPPGAVAGHGSSWPASRRSSSTPSPRRTCRTRRASCAVGARLTQDALLRDLFDLGYAPVTEVAGRGEFARRGGIVDVFPPSRDLPIRVESFGDEIDSLRAFDPTDQRTTGKVDAAVLLPASEFLLPNDGVDVIRARLGRTASRLGERLGIDLARFEGAADDPLPAGDRAGPRAPSPSVTRRRSGRRTSRQPPAWITSRRARSSSSTSPATSPRPPPSCGARRTSADPS